jgi:hypothetical protein
VRRKLAGVLIIFGGLIGGSFCAAMGRWIGIPLIIFGLLMGIVAVGAVSAFKRIHYNWALAGAIISITFPLFGIPAIILLLKSKPEFSQSKITKALEAKQE